MTRVRSRGRLRMAGPIALVAILVAAIPARAQEPPPPIPRIALDVHATVPRFPQDVNLADSRGLSSAAELPGTGIGGQLAVHVYPLKWRGVSVRPGGGAVGGGATYQAP